MSKPSKLRTNIKNKQEIITSREFFGTNHQRWYWTMYWTARAACTWLWSKCFNHLQMMERKIIQKNFLNKINFNDRLNKIAFFYLPMMFQPIMVSKKSYRRVWVCSHRLFVTDLKPIHSCNFVHRTQQNCSHPIEMHHEWIRRVHGLLPMAEARYVWFLPDSEHGVTAQNNIKYSINIYNNHESYTCNVHENIYSMKKKPIAWSKPKTDDDKTDTGDLVVYGKVCPISMSSFG